MRRLKSNGIPPNLQGMRSFRLLYHRLQDGYTEATQGHVNVTRRAS